MEDCSLACGGRIILYDRGDFLIPSRLWVLPVDAVLKRFLLGFAPLLLWFGSPLEAARPDVASALSAVKLTANERYSNAEGKAGLCDIYVPTTNPPKQGHPAVVVVHGGGWVSGDKWTLEGYSRVLASNGFVVVTINYRLAPQHKFPSQVDDVRDALVWTAKNAERLSIDLSRLGMFGYSAGGHLSTLVSLVADEPMDVQLSTSKWNKQDPRWKSLPKVCAVCAGGPPCEFRSLPIDNTTLSYFLGGSRREKPDVYEAASPTAHVSAGDPVTQIIHGESDLLVPIASSRSLEKALSGVGVEVRFTVIPKQGHMLTFLNPQTRQQMLAFFQDVLK